ncbi:uncharacterized protein C5orf49-like [Branchiostoma floridae]|uniref:Uncharacterized protein C5orf49-like n=1 Tax=Branchiostoma floridae TaxID=7739 RepID=C3ZFS9_BRAFL|nr:uncharacterized protein C5orf49-like [Branchiostoma floridae]|eukprot:XP_002592556.1 hypothetical protein BRAFLDRAFT_118905 [Branchiostoma floridae]
MPRIEGLDDGYLEPVDDFNEEVEKLPDVAKTFLRSLEGQHAGIAAKLPPPSLSAYSYVPTRREHPKPITYFNNDKKDRPVSTYDRLFHQPQGYNNKLHRDDREHAKLKGLDVNSEERVKDVPTLSSSDYGHKLDQFKDPPDRKHVRIMHVRTEFYRRNDINISPDKSLH